MQGSHQAGDHEADTLQPVHDVFVDDWYVSATLEMNVVFVELVVLEVASQIPSLRVFCNG